MEEPGGTYVFNSQSSAPRYNISWTREAVDKYNLEFEAGKFFGFWR